MKKTIVKVIVVVTVLVALAFSYAAYLEWFHDSEMRRVEEAYQKAMDELHSYTVVATIDGNYVLLYWNNLVEEWQVQVTPMVES